MTALLSRGTSFVLAVLLAVQVASAFLPVPAAGGQDGAVSLVICSAEGEQVITLPQAAGEASSDGMAPHGHCPLCILSAALPECGGLDPVARRLALSLRYRVATGPQTHGPDDRRPHAIRAPPLTV